MNQTTLDLTVCDKCYAIIERYDIERHKNWHTNLEKELYITDIKGKTVILH
jgi:hypothetical protein